VEVPDKLYHWTHCTNINSIGLKGLDPIFATGNRRVVYGVARERIAWALGHIAAHHGVSPDELVLMLIITDHNEWKKTGSPLVWCTESIVKPCDLPLLKSAVDGAWVTFYERS